MNDQTELPLGEIDGALLADHIGDLDPPPEKWAATLASLVDHLADFYRRNGRNDEAAIGEAQKVVALLAHDFGGRPIYLPRGDRLQQALVARQIYLLHNGRNVEELAERFGYTVRHVQRVYAEQRSIETRKRQSQLF
ncbi:Mor transcription activator family protein [Dyella sp. 2RAB6]|uniref:Mor transcription activator family protein n=1 Tax=Dyella sp. 2RAB6 TaxID=3232992 RepID=UPI003F9225EB